MIVVFNVTVIAEHNFLDVFIFAVEAGIGVVLLEKVLLVFRRLLQFFECLVCSLLFVDDIVEILHFLGALAIGRLVLVSPDATFLEMQPDDAQDTHYKCKQMQLEVE